MSAPAADPVILLVSGDQIDVLTDQFTLMQRCGITAFVVTNEGARKALETGAFSTVNLFYQPIGTTEVPVGTRPFLRRPAKETEKA